MPNGVLKLHRGCQGDSRWLGTALCTAGSGSAPVDDSHQMLIFRFHP